MKSKNIGIVQLDINTCVILYIRPLFWKIFLVINIEIKNVTKAVLQNYAMLDFLATLISKPDWVI
jgi:hypothetical protein